MRGWVERSEGKLQSGLYETGTSKLFFLKEKGFRIHIMLWGSLGSFLKMVAVHKVNVFLKMGGSVLACNHDDLYSIHSTM